MAEKLMENSAFCVVRMTDDDESIIKKSTIKSK